MLEAMRAYPFGYTWIFATAGLVRLIKGLRALYALASDLLVFDCNIFYQPIDYKQTICDKWGIILGGRGAA